MSIKPSNTIPWEVVLDDGSTSTRYVEVMKRWKHDFELLLNYQNDRTIELCDLPDIPVNHLDTSSLGAVITIEEVRYASLKANKGKALGNDQIPLAALDLHIVFTKIVQFMFLFMYCTCRVVTWHY